MMAIENENAKRCSVMYVAFNILNQIQLPVSEVVKIQSM